MTMNDTWGYKSYDDNWKSTEKLIRNLIDIASKGGNYLLNVGPTAEGLIPEPSVERLRGIGRWMDVNGQSIYGTQASPFQSTPWGRCTQKSCDDGTTLYLHVFNWPADGQLDVPELNGKVKRAYLLADSDKDMSVASTGNGVTIGLPSAAPDPICTVVVLETAGD